MKVVTEMKFSVIRTLGYYLGGIWTAWGGRKRIAAKQLKNLRHLVKVAREKSPYFHELYRDLPDSKVIKLSDLPVTSKIELMADFDRWLTDRSLTLAQARQHMESMDNLGVPIGDYAVFRTSGTSGEPAVIVASASMIEYIFGLTLARMSRRQFRLAKEIERSGTNVVLTGGNGHFVGAGFDLLRQNLKIPLKRTFQFIPAEQSIDQTVKQLNEIKPMASIVTYPSMLAILTREQELGRLQIEPDVLKVAGETFTPELRERAQKAFPSLQFEILDGYGCTECLFMAFGCDCGRQHVPEDWVILEAVDENHQPVADGTLSATALLTVLANEVQPLIRYEIGDRLRFYPDPCPCGSPFRSFEVEGRQATLVRVGEVTLSPLAFDLEHEGAQRVQMIQTSEDVFEIRAELLTDENPDQVFEQIIRSVGEVFTKNGLSGVKIHKSDDPPQLTASGKFHEVISRPLLPARGR
jgi:phenylacetate-coenzyme A ligase PaaK-like adenylate-forming protein